MVHLHPFSAHHVAPDQVKEFASPPIDSLSSYEIDRVIDKQPHSLLGIIQPHQKENFQNIRNRFLKSPYLIREPTPSFYIYEIIQQNRVYKGIIAGVSCNNSSTRIVFPHENTLEKREKLFEKYLETVQFNAEPVLLAFEDSKPIQQLLNDYSKQSPFYDFTLFTQRHRLWKISDCEKITNIKSIFENHSTLYIADGHHRWASSCRLSKSSLSQKAQYCMCFLLPASSLQLDSFYRIIDFSKQLTCNEFISRLSHTFTVSLSKKYQTPGHKKSFSFYTNGDWYIANYPKKTELTAVELLYKKIINPILGIENDRNNPRIEYGYSQHPNKLIEEKIKERSDFLGITHFPINFEQIKSKADQGVMLPPKSSYIQPKMISGMLLHAW